MSLNHQFVETIESFSQIDIKSEFERIKESGKRAVVIIDDDPDMVDLLYMHVTLKMQNPDLTNIGDDNIFVFSLPNQIKKHRASSRYLEQNKFNELLENSEILGENIFFIIDLRLEELLKDFIDIEYNALLETPDNLSIKPERISQLGNGIALAHIVNEKTKGQAKIEIWSTNEDFIKREDLPQGVSIVAKPRIQDAVRFVKRKQS